MRHFNINKVITCICIISGITSLFFGINAYDASKKIENRLVTAGTFNSNNISSYEKNQGNKNISSNENHSPAVLEQVNSSKGIFQSSDQLLLDEEIKKIKDIMEFTGMDRLAETCDVFPEEIRAAFYKRLKEKDMKACHEALKVQSYDQYQEDNDIYGSEVNRLYLQTFNSIGRYRSQDSKEETENDKAENRLLEKYPDSYAAARIFYNRTVKYLQTRDSELYAAEESFDALMDMQSSKLEKIAIEDGFEAVPTAAYRLIGAYKKQGRINDANNLMVFLQNNYSNSIYQLRKPGANRTGLYSGEEAMEIIRSMYELDAEY